MLSEGRTFSREQREVLYSPLLTQELAEKIYPEKKTPVWLCELV